MKKTTNQAYEILEDAGTNTNQWPKDRITPVKAVGGAYKEVLSNLVTHVAQLKKQLTKHQGVVNAIQTSPWELCEFCGGQHSCHTRRRKTIYWDSLLVFFFFFRH